MDLSIIIASFNTKALLDRCLWSIQTSLRDTLLSYEIIVVDNASTDGTRELLHTKYPRVITIFNKENIGYGKANNIAIKGAKGAYILLLNSDIEVKNGSIVSLYDFGKAHPKTFTGGKLFNEDGTVQPSCGPMYTLPIVACMLFAKGDTLGITRYSPTQTRRVDWVSGACLLGPKEGFEKVGFFDEKIFLYMEEIDFLYRAKQQNYEIFFTHQSQFIHTGAASSASRKTPVINIYKGLLYFYKKHRSIIEQKVLLILLFTKAALAIFIGTLTRKKDLTHTYEQAIRLV